MNEMIIPKKQMSTTMTKKEFSSGLVGLHQLLHTKTYRIMENIADNNNK